MKTLAFVLFVLLSIQSYGVFGAYQADRILYTCTAEVGPLCFAWEESGWAKLVGPERAAELESRLAEARAAWEEGFVARFLKGDEPSSVERALQRAKEVMEALED